MSEQNLLFKDEAFKIVGCSMKVLNTLGHGFREKIYENALSIELTTKGIKNEQQKSYMVFYQNIAVGELIPDIIVDDNIVIDTKTIDSIGDSERGQMLNYLKVTGHRLGLIINFRNPELEWERVVR